MSASRALDTMQAIVIARAGGPEVLERREVEAPVVRAHEVRIRVEAFGVNRADVLQRQGRYPAPPGVVANIPGLECAGIIESVGEGVAIERVGEPVMALVAGGAYAEKVVVHERELIRRPRGLDPVAAAAIPEAFATAYDALFLQAGLQAGETLLVHAVGSGVGLAALALAKRSGARVVGTSRTADKLRRAALLGLDVGVLSTAPGWSDEVQRHVPRGIDVVLDLVGAATLAGDLEVVATRGRIVMVGLVSGAKAELQLGKLLAKRAHLIGTVLRSRPLDEKIALARSFEHAVVPGFESGALKPQVDTVMSAREVGRAHELLESNTTFGKIVLTW